MKVFKKQTSDSIYPIIDNCYLAENDTTEDVSSYQTYFEFFKVNQIDYIQFRRYCKANVLPKWNLLSDTEKTMLKIHNIRPESEPYSLSFTEYTVLVDRERKARQRRWLEALAVAGYRLLGNQLYQLMIYNDVKNMKDDYIDADLPHLRLWILSGTYPELGIDYTTNGFASKVYYNEQIKNEVLKILDK